MAGAGVVRVAPAAVHGRSGTDVVCAGAVTGGLGFSSSESEIVRSTFVRLIQPQLLHLSRSSLLGSSHLGQVHFSLGFGFFWLQLLHTSRSALFGSSHFGQIHFVGASGGFGTASWSASCSAAGGAIEGPRDIGRPAGSGAALSSSGPGRGSAGGSIGSAGGASVEGGPAGGTSRLPAASPPAGRPAPQLLQQGRSARFTSSHFGQVQRSVCTGAVPPVSASSVECAWST
mmetsp:Transcript_65835/g.189818  ORF Transcript_65835/g.189818 Transcript_65835/m.189818 type:complete len:230 (-) Transcript_65835:137-826(-)